MEIWPRKPYPLDATYDGSGTNFTLYSTNTKKIELCLADDDGLEMDRLELTKINGYVWHGYVPNLRLGQHCGYRVYGSYDPTSGKRFNPSKLLLDPYAKAIAGDLGRDMSIFAYSSGNPGGYNNDDPATHTMHSVVVNPFSDWGNDRHPDLEYPELVIYETHIRGMTMLSPTIPERPCGTYTGIGRPKSIEYLQRLEINVLELISIRQFVTDPSPQEKGLTNYWGCNTIRYFASHNAYYSKP